MEKFSTEAISVTGYNNVFLGNQYCQNVISIQYFSECLYLFWPLQHMQGRFNSSQHLGLLRLSNIECVRTDFLTLPTAIQWSGSGYRHQSQVRRCHINCYWSTSTINFGTESCRTHDHILLPHGSRNHATLAPKWAQEHCMYKYNGKSSHTPN